jgi:hypothetical protein
MCRIVVLGLALLVPLPAAWSQESKKDDDQGLKVEGKLSPDDPRDKVQKKSPHQVHILKMKKGQAYQIDLVSRAFDAFLRLEDESGKQLASDDDGGGALNSRLFITAPADGSYRLIATSLDGKPGPYTLTAKAASASGVAANAAFTALMQELQKAYAGVYQKLNSEYVEAKTDDEKEKALATFAKRMDEFAERADKVAKDFPKESTNAQATMLARQIRSMVPSVRGQILVSAGNALREQYEKAYEAKAKNVAELYEKARTYFAETAKKHADKDAVASQLKDGLYLLENLSIGKTAPEIEAEDLDGQKFKLSDYRGKVVVLDFWGHW